MNNKLILKRASLSSLAVLGYIIVITQILNHGQIIFGKMSALATIAFLMLFVFSALLVGYLILGKPLTLYLDNKKKEALRLLSAEIIILFGLTLVTFVIVLVFK